MVKRNDYQIRHRLQMGVPLILCGNHCDGGDGNDQFWLRWRILIAILLDRTGNGEVEQLLGGGGLAGARMLVQNMPLDDVPECWNPKGRVHT